MKSITTFIVLLTVTSVSTAGEWPRFRGPEATGVAPDHADLPMSWTTTDNVKWVAEVPGWGWSNPIVSGDKVFLTTVVSEASNLTPSKGLYLGEGVREPAKGMHLWLVYCFDLNSGKQLWKREAHAGRPKVPRHPKSTYASETPTTDGQRLYVLFGDLGLYCYDLNGKPLWARPIEPKKTFQDYGAAASPVVHDGQVFVVYDNLEDSFIASFDATSGEQRWRRARGEKRSWATPLVWKNKLRTEVVVPGLNRNRSYSLDGELLWEFDGRMSSLVIPSPFAAHGMCYIASGYVGDAHRPTFAVKPGASGDITPQGDFEESEFIAWYDGKSSPYNPSQIVYGDYLYTLYDRGFFTCHDAKTGKEVYGKQRLSPSGSFTSSPWAYNGHLFCLSEDGLTYVVKAGPKFEIVGRSDLTELCLACPAMAGDKLLIRTASKLYCLTKGARLDPAVAARMRPGKKAATYRDIFAAVREGQTKEVARMLDSGVSVNVRLSGRGPTPLNTAAVYGQTDVAKLLLARGADPALANQDGNTALLIAAFFCHIELVDLLIERGASATVKNKQGETPIDVVTAPWSEALAETYRSIGRAVGRQLDLERIKNARPKVMRQLKEHVEGGDRDSSPLSTALRQATNAVDSAISSGKVAGVVHLVAKNGRTVHEYAGGVRDIEDKKPMTPDTIVRIYSMTKPIVSVAAMTLYEQGKFELDDPISKFLPAFENSTVWVKKDGKRVAAPAKRPITVRDVFRHTTGYGYGGNGDTELDARYRSTGLQYRPPHGMLPPEMTIAKAADKLAATPAHHHPGERFTYGFSTDLLGRLIEVWSEMPLDEYVRNSVLNPLEMNDTGFAVAPDKRDRFASCHTTTDGKLKVADKAASSPFNRGFTFVSGGGGLTSTARDYLKFCQMLVDGGQRRGRHVLKPETLDLMFTNQLKGAAGDFRFGLGFAINSVQLGTGESRRSAEQYSWGGYASTDFRVIPAEKVVQVFIRQHVPSSHQLANRVFGMVYVGVGDKPRVPKVMSIEEKTRIHRLSTNKRSVYDAFAYVNRIPEKAEKGESAEDLAGRIFSRLANQEGRVLLKVPPGMDRQAYLGFKTFLRYEGTISVGNCAACHAPPEFTDLKTYVVTPNGSAKPTPSLRNLGKRRIDLRKVLLEKITASQRKRSADDSDIDAGYVSMNISEKDIPNLEAFLKLLNDVPDKDFRKLILDATVLDTSDEQ